jgi:hypothetical protein
VSPLAPPGGCSRGAGSPSPSAVASRS